MDTIPNSKAAGVATAATTAVAGRDFSSTIERVLSHDLPQPRSPPLGLAAVDTAAAAGGAAKQPAQPAAAAAAAAAPRAVSPSSSSLASSDDDAGAAAAARASTAAAADDDASAGSGDEAVTDGDAQLPMPEPFKIKMVEAISLLPRPQREARLKQAGYNVFCLKSQEVFIDLLTDSGMSALSDKQWAGMLVTPQAYAGSSSFFILEDVVRDLMGFKHILPEHQGRAAENVLFSVTVAPRPGCYVPNNTHFDTTEANVLRCGGHPVNLPVPEAYDTAAPSLFKGNMDVDALEAFLQDKGRDQVPLVMITVTNNSAGGQPVSMGNVRQVSAICKRHGIPFFVDAARFAENCWFIQQYEPGYGDKSIADIARELFSYADGCTFSGKKEALANVGGLLCCNDDALYEQLRNLTIVIEGFPTYGGIACRDLMAMAEGLKEVVQESYQEYRHSQIELLAGLLRAGGVPIVEPPGGHAVYVDAARFLPHIPGHQFPAQALTAALYAESGVRGVEIGSSCFGHTDPDTGAFTPARLELLRLAIPRRVYTDNHLRYVAAALVNIYRRRRALSGLRRVYATPLLSHFTARFEPIGSDAAPANDASLAKAPAAAPAPAGEAAAV